MAIGVIAVLSLLLPPLSVVSSAVVALVTLRRGVVDGVVIAVLGAGATALLALLVNVDVLPVVGFTLLLWLPIWALAQLLRTTRSLAVTIIGALMFGVLVILVYSIQFQDPVQQWRTLLDPMLQSLGENRLFEPEQKEILLNLLAHWMTGIMAAGFFLQLMASLLLARWWQAMLYNPGGFGLEFQQLKLPRLMAIAAIGIVALSLLEVGIGSPFLDYLAMLFLAAYFIQGLAVAHGIIAKLGANLGWLIGLYILLFVAMPHTATALAAAGVADAWFDFRTRFGKRKHSGGTS